MRLLFVFLLLALTKPSLAAKVSIVIDDMGYRYTDQQALSLPGNVTFSILPHTPFGQNLAKQISDLNKEVILHIPMEATNGKFMGPGGLSSAMDKTQLLHELGLAFANIPQAIGINNHMGSKLTTLKQPMQWTMEFLKNNNLFFLDSRTSRFSLAASTAKESGVPTLTRHVFLDNLQNDDYISQQFHLMVRHAQKHKHTIAIAHPHPQSVATLTRLIPSLAAQGIELVPISTLFEDIELTAKASQATD